MKVISLYNMKGGVGKTTVCVNLAYLSAIEGKRTLLIDLDPQGASSYYFRIRPSKKFNTKKFLTDKKKLFGSIKATDYDNLDLLPATLAYRNFDILLDSRRRSKKQLLRIIGKFKKEYDVIFLDAPPNLTLLSENIFNVSDKVLLPVIPTTLSILAGNKVKEFMKKNSYESKKLLTFFSMVESRKKMHSNQMEDYLSNNKRVLKSFIPYSSEIEKMGVYREPLPAKFNRSKATQSFVELWQEIKEKVGI